LASRNSAVRSITACSSACARSVSMSAMSRATRRSASALITSQPSAITDKASNTPTSESRRASVLARSV